MTCLACAESRDVVDQAELRRLERPIMLMSDHTGATISRGRLVTNGIKYLWATHTIEFVTLLVTGLLALAAFFADMYMRTGAASDRASASSGRIFLADTWPALATA
jgi:hypothetical protein